MRIFNKDGSWGAEIDTRAASHSFNPLEVEQAEHLKRQEKVRLAKAVRDEEYDAQRQRRIISEWSREAGSGFESITML